MNLGLNLWIFKALLHISLLSPLTDHNCFLLSIAELAPMNVDLAISALADVHLDHSAIGAQDKC